MISEQDLSGQDLWGAAGLPHRHAADRAALPHDGGAGVRGLAAELLFQANRAAAALRARRGIRRGRERPGAGIDAALRGRDRGSRS